jgi:endoglucanase
MDKMNSYVYSTVSEFKTRPTPVADVSTSKIRATYLAGSYALGITANSTWSVTSNQPWCTVLPASGEGNKEITVSVMENTTDALRTATLTVTAGSQTKQVTVEQDILSFSVSATTINAANTVANYTFNM